MNSSTEASSTQPPYSEPLNEPRGSRLSSGQPGASSPTVRLYPNNTLSRESLDPQRHQEDWQQFLRQVAPEDIAQRDAADPVRLAYIQNRYEEARRRRRRAITTSASGAASSSSQALLPADGQGQYVSGTGLTRKRPRSLQLQDRPLPQPPFPIREDSFTNGEYTVPRWQPDEEASNCPICGRSFSVFYRRHHCRKCGRVVCSMCSPHRITIPRQFIVQPPSELEEQEQSREARTVIDLTGQDGAPLTRTGSTPQLGGGQEVRLCNPCVPDPNPLPPPTYLSPGGQHFLPGPPGGSAPQDYSPSRYGPRYALPPPPVAQSTRPYLQITSPPSSGHVRPNARQSWAGPHYSSLRPNSLNLSYPSGGLRTPFGSAPSSSHLSNYPHPLPPPPSSAGLYRRHPRGNGEALIPPTPPPPPPVREEDECPVCHSGLPPKGTDGSETEREAHVSQCIESHFSSSVPRSARPAPEAAVAAAVVASAATSAQAGGDDAAAASVSAADVRTSGGGGTSSSAPQSNTLNVGSAGASSLSGFAPIVRSSRRRTTGMVVYAASEKDCISGDGAQQECVICFDEFAVGDEMGRLECLCKFHKTCIRAWWDAKGPGSCPMHQDGI